MKSFGPILMVTGVIMALTVILFAGSVSNVNWNGIIVSAAVPGFAAIVGMLLMLKG